MKLNIVNYNKFDKKLKAAVVDNIGGAYIPVALALKDQFSKVYYHSVVQNPFPKISTSVIGKGYDGIEVIDTFWDKLELFDIVIFPDIYFSDWGHALRKIGKLVWGGCQSEVLETNRKLFKDELKSVGLPIAKTQYIKGVDNLKKYLHNNSDKYLKVSFFRGEFETTHHINYNHSQVFLDELDYTSGPLGDELDFIVEDPIPSIAEIGSDGFSVNGMMPKNFVLGLEVKNCGFVGKAMDIVNSPSPITNVNNKFEPVLKKYNHTGFYSTEVRIGEDGNDYYIDPCMRAGSPPSNTYLTMISNWGDIITQGAQGKIVEPIFKYKYGCEIILKSNIVNKNFLPLVFPEKYENNIRLKGSFKKDGRYYIIPFKNTGFDMVEFGSVVVCGDDVNSIMNQALEIANSIEGYEVDYDKTALKTALEYINDTEEALKFKF